MIYLFFTGGSGNRGCEAIVRGTKEIIKKPQMIVYSAHLDEEKESGLNQIIECRPLTNNKHGLQAVLSQIVCWLSYHLGNQKMQVREIYSDFLKAVKKDDTYLVIGGDVYCYDKPRIYYRVNEILKNNKKILWGCSIEPDSIDSEMKKDLLGYNMIYARESITYNGLMEHGIKNNVKLCPDPAFKMKAQEISLSDEFIENRMVGINVSPLIMNLEKNSGITLKNYEILIEDIIENTNYNVALIPHVIWNNNDDRIPLKKLYDKYFHTGRIIMIEGYSAEKIKYVISRCRFLVAARTHASIAAYSTCVPTLVVGYSVKARGIAKDIFGTYDNYVIPVQQLQKKDDLSKAFRWIMNNESAIKEHLNSYIPDYIAKIDDFNIL